MTLSAWRLLGLAGVAFGTPAAAQIVTSSPFRYDDDVTVYAGRDDAYAHLRYIPLGGDSFASLGADLRERVEASNVTSLGLRSRTSDLYDLHRLLIDADLQIGPVIRVFAQLGSHDEIGRNGGPAPLDRDRLDLSQGFVDVTAPVGAGHLLLRAGRAEMSFDDGALIGLRDGPNIRRSWDGVRTTYRAGALQLDAFAVRPVAVHPGVFDDAGAGGEALQGVHLTSPAGPTMTIDAFYYRNINPRVAILGVGGRERTDTAGVRLRAKWTRVDGSVGAIVQGGQADGRPVRAFALHGDVGLALGPTPSGPHVAFRADILSGGDPNGRRIGTFNALYPNVAYSTEATIEAPANLIQVGAVALTPIGRAVSVQYALEGLWRYTSRDAFYAAPLAPLIRPNGTDDRFSGTEQQARIAWRANRIITVTAALVRFSVGSALRQEGAHNENFGMTSVALRL